MSNFDSTQLSFWGRDIFCIAFQIKNPTEGNVCEGLSTVPLRFLIHICNLDISSNYIQVTVTQAANTSRIKLIRPLLFLWVNSQGSRWWHLAGIWGTEGRRLDSSSISFKELRQNYNDTPRTYPERKYRSTASKGSSENQYLFKSWIWASQGHRTGKCFLYFVHPCIETHVFLSS